MKKALLALALDGGSNPPGSTTFIYNSLCNSFIRWVVFFNQPHLVQLIFLTKSTRVILYFLVTPLLARSLL